MNALALTLLAQGPEAAETAASGGYALGFHLLAGIIFSLVGITVLGVCFWLMERITPFSIVKEIEEHQNTSLAIVMGAVVIAMSIIISAAIHG